MILNKLFQLFFSIIIFNYSQLHDITRDAEDDGGVERRESYRLMIDIQFSIGQYFGKDFKICN